MLARTHVEAFLHGNVAAYEAAALCKAVVQTLASEPLLAEDRPRDDVICIPFGASYLHRCPLIS